MEYSLFKKYIDSVQNVTINGEESILNLVILDKKGTKDELSLLENIFKAINVDLLKDCLVLDVINLPDFRLNQISSIKTIKNIYLFGVTPKLIGAHLNIPQYCFIDHQSTNYIIADTLSNVNIHKNLKMKLWQALKEKFKG